MENKLCLKENYILLNGFDLIKDVATFCLYPGGVVISPGTKGVYRQWYYKIKVESDRTIKNKELLNHLKNRGFGESTSFAKIENDYFEMHPHNINLKHLG